MQGSHTHIPETNNVPRGYIVAAILSLLFMVPLCLVPALVLLFFYVSTFRSIYYYYYYYINNAISFVLSLIRLRTHPSVFTRTHNRVYTEKGSVSTRMSPSVRTA